MRRILIFSLVYYPRFIGGAEVAVKEITDRISDTDIQFDMITLRKHASAFEHVGNVNVYRVGMPWFGKDSKSSKLFPLSKILFVPLAALKAISLHRKQKYDAVWPIMASYGGFSAVLFRMIYPNVPMILTVQEGDNFERRQGIFRPLFKKIFTSATRIQVISNYLAEWARSFGATAPIEVIPNGVDCEKFIRPISLIRKSEIRTEAGFSETDIVLVTASRLVYKNAVDTIIAALALLPQNYKLLILGTGADEQALRNQVQSLKLESRVIFKGFISHDLLPEYLQASEIFIRPSRTEGLGNSFLEAMAVGIPVIATPVGGIPDFLTDGQTGLFCEVDNPQSIAQKVEKLTKDKESRDYIVTNARTMVTEDYDWRHVAAEMKDVFTIN
jgi:glycosyltransferase involved in cell wall biosynthesis